MNEEKYILARLKADIICEILKNDKYSTQKEVYQTVLQKIAKYEAEAILGDVIEEVM